MIFATGIRMGESPRWHDGRFWMCDWLAGEILAFAPDGTRQVVARVEGLPFSIDWLSDGRMLVTTNNGVRVGPELAPHGPGGQPWNEIVVDPAGRVWVDMPGAMPWEEPKPGVVGVVDPDGGGRVVADDVWFPNGMAVTPDGSTLIVAESHAHRLTAFTITDAGAAHSFEPAFPCHSALMGANKWGLTSLRNLDRLPPTGAVLIVCPLPIVGGSGSPARVLALVERA